MVDAGKEVVRIGKDEQVVGVNSDMKVVRVNARVHHVYNVIPLTTMKNSKRIIKLKLVKIIEGESSSAGTTMELY